MFKKYWQSLIENLKKLLTGKVDRVMITTTIIEPCDKLEQIVRNFLRRTK